MIIRIPIRTWSEANARLHWAARAKRVKQQRGTTALVVAAELAIRGRNIKPPCVVTIVRFGPTSGLDDDNLVSSQKAVRDGIAEAFGLDDADPGLTWRYEQRRTKAWGVEIRIEARAEVAA